MSGICDGRVVIVTGAGRGLGRAHALAFAAEGAKVVVNDLGTEVDGTGSSPGPAGRVVDEIRGAGGDAIANGDDVSDFDAAGALVRTAIDTYGKLDVLVNNAGILRDRMVFGMSAEEWDAVIRVHLRGTFGPAHHASAHWRELAKAGEELDARIINTTSPSGIFGNIGQTNYGAAKAGIAAFTVIAAMELERYGVTVNAISPSARTRMTENLGGAVSQTPADAPFDPYAPAAIAPLVVWLGSGQSRGVTGRVFMVGGGRVGIAEGWHPGPSVEQDEVWPPARYSDVLPGLISEAASNATMRE
jgi:NAD(P)-dependent dehydrogenase (short-subunit alcohol dehydrogenase family)